MEKQTKTEKEVMKIPIESDMTQTQEDTALAQSMKRTGTMRKPNWFKIGIATVVILGLGTGYVVAAVTKSPTVLPLESSTTGTGTEAQGIKVGQVFGSKDASAFKDSAEGVLLPGGTDSEGSHHLVRPGGASQNVYLTSSILELKLFENAKVKVYGETFQARKAGWLMDVGRVEVIELNPTLPDWVIKEQQKNPKVVPTE